MTNVLDGAPGTATTPATNAGAFPLVCPDCRRTLDLGAGQYACPQCGRTFRIEAWGPSFVTSAAETTAPREMEVRDLEASWYEEAQIDGKAASFIRLQTQLLLAEIAGAPPGAVMDAGCGTGLFTGALLGTRREVVAVDFSGESLRVLAGKHLPTAATIQADLMRLPLPDQVFGAAVVNLVLQHIPPASRSLVLAELRRCLVPGGVAIATVYNRAVFERRGEATVGAYEKGQPYFSFSHGELRAELEAAGFVDCEVRPLGIGLYVRNLRPGGWRLYRLLHPALNLAEGMAHRYLPPGHAYPSEYWIVRARRPL